MSFHCFGVILVTNKHQNLTRRRALWWLPIIDTRFFEVCNWAGVSKMAAASKSGYTVAGGREGARNKAESRSYWEAIGGGEGLADRPL